ncbi:hypothetical protein M569_01027, partial [Genlisea aurea]
MDSLTSKTYADDVSLLMVLMDANPFSWDSLKSAFPFSNFLSHVVSFLNAILLLNPLNHVVVIATGFSYCDFIFDSTTSQNQSQHCGETLLQRLEEFVEKDESMCRVSSVHGSCFSLLSGSLSMALCYIQRIFRTGNRHPQPRILCLHGSPDGPGQYIAIMNSIFSAQRLMVPIDSCLVGAEHSAFLQQASHITRGVYLKPQIPPDGLS